MLLGGHRKKMSGIFRCSLYLNSLWLLIRRVVGIKHAMFFDWNRSSDARLFRICRIGSVSNEEIERTILYNHSW